MIILLSTTVSTIIDREVTAMSGKDTAGVVAILLLDIQAIKTAIEVDCQKEIIIATTREEENE